jgi:hypothetical protein
MIIDGYKKLDKKTFKKFKPDQSQIFIDHYKSMHEDTPGCIINSLNHIEHFSFDLDNHIQDIYYLDPKTAQAFGSVLAHKKHYNYFIFEILNQLIDHEHIFKPFTLN